MARFRCPTDSADDLANDRIPQRLASMTITTDKNHNAAGPSKRHARRDKNKLKTPAGMSLKEKGNLKKAFKKNANGPKTTVPKVNINNMRSDWSFVFVGNLNRNIDEKILFQAFMRFGHVTRVQIRTSSGTPFAGAGPVAANSNDRQYASVEFSDASAARRALKMNGHRLFGIKLAVCLSAADLPETQEIVNAHMAKKVPAPKMDVQAAFNAIKRVTIDRTQYINAEAGPSRAGPSTQHQDVTAPARPRGLQPLARTHAFAAMSFPKTVM
ncbi:uncharacterized protein FIBRA_05536 [Fibroporia radiculosa]|uniref:RRM domain-containing protein n=1 Tax=Fibroporia radiculosa TaxID=599839 RepID=J4GR77_9APHY|nr:uncharacterized protein FIBRA_05536 [Fibroporia radiculosa]CCM03405.1 predicted protein [Fibroporia radiculosa]